MLRTDMIFVAGNSRSGTTLMGRILGLHENIFTFHELHFFEQLWTSADRGRKISMEESADLYARLLRSQRSGIFSKDSVSSYMPEALENLSSDEVTTREDVFELFLKKESRIHHKQIPCEQTPRNLIYTKEILEIFPNAKMIMLVRDPRDVLLSQKKKWRRRFLGASNIPRSESIRSWINYHPIVISKLWRMNFKIIEKYKNHPSVLTIRFEDLIQDPVRTLPGICDFLKISFTPKMLWVPKIGSSNSKDKREAGIEAQAAGQWNRGGLTKSEIYYCEKICGVQITQAGYALSNVKPTIVPLVVDALVFPFKLAMAFLVNIKRMKNLRESLSRRLNLSKI